MNVCVHVFIYGRVQGVFYRVNTKNKANELGLKGWVRNRYDGSVEALFEGDKDIVDKMISWCKKGPRLSIVEGVKINYEDYTGEYDNFIIK